jgi:hypothetical protein
MISAERFFCTEIRQLSESRQAVKRQPVWIERLGMDVDLHVGLIAKFRGRGYEDGVIV